MSGHEFLTLAITETVVNTGKFNVISLHTKTQEIVPFYLHKEEIITSEGKSIWDIGFTTIVNEEPQRKYDNNTNSQFVLKNIAQLGENRISSLKSILEAKSGSANEFFENEKKAFCVIKVDLLDDIIVKESRDKGWDNHKKYYVKDVEPKHNKHYIKVKTSAVPIYKNPLLILNKDYRWIHYWNWVSERGILKEKKEKYLRLYNLKRKDLYLILYRHHYEENNNCWVAGMHWL